MRVWKVKIVDYLTMHAGHPFSNLTRYIEAESREDAIERAKDRYPTNRYTVKSASPSNANIFRCEPTAVEECKICYGKGHWISKEGAEIPCEFCEILLRRALPPCPSK